MKIFFRNLLVTICLCLTILSTIAILLVLCGFRPFILKSPSMEPLFTENSLVIIDTKISPEDVSIGDVLVYRNADTLVMHRMVGENTFQGDANQTQEYVELSGTNLVGKEVFVIPYLGAIADASLTKPVFLWIIIAFALLLSCLPHFKKENRHEYLYPRNTD